MGSTLAMVLQEGPACVAICLTQDDSCAVSWWRQRSPNGTRESLVERGLEVDLHWPAIFQVKDHKGKGGGEKEDATH